MVLIVFVLHLYIIYFLFKKNLYIKMCYGISILLHYLYAFVGNEIKIGYNHARFPDFVNTDSSFETLIYANLIYIIITYLLTFKIFKTKRILSFKIPDFSLLKKKVKLSRIKIFLFFLVAVLISILISDRNFIWNATYGGIDSRYEPIISGVFWKIFLSTFLTYLYVSSNFSGYRFLSTVIILFSLIIFMGKGDRGGFLPIWLTIVSITTLNKKYFKSLFLLSITAYFVIFWSPFRSTLFQLGFIESINYSHTAVINVINFSSYNSSFSYYEFPLLPQSVWHWHHSYSLYNLNNVLGFSAFTNLLLQIFPEFIFNFFNYERPLNLAWKLAEFRIHGGGMYHLAGGYWSIGFFGVAIWSLLVNLLNNFFERFLQLTNFVDFSLYFILAGSCFYTVYYGWQPYIKLFLFVYIFKILYSWIKK